MATVTIDAANGHTPTNGTPVPAPGETPAATAAVPPRPATGFQQPAQAAPATPSASAQALQHARSVLTRVPAAAAAVAPSPRLSTGEWLVRAAFTLFAVIAIGIVAFSGLGLMSPMEALVVLSPVTALAGMIIGVYLGSDASHGPG